MITNYIELARPKTLPLALSPLLVSLALAYFSDFKPDLLVIVATFACPALLQIAANAHNDVKDFESGTDNKDRLGPQRQAASGQISPGNIKIFTWFCIFLSLIPGIYLVSRFGMFPLLLGVFCIIGALSYAGGKYSVSFSPFGELYVIFFFGLVAVGGSHYIFAGENDAGVYLIGASLGFLAANVLLVNNYRDMETDKAAGRKTLCVLIGRKKALVLYKFFFVAAHFNALWGMNLHFDYPFFFIPFIGLPFFVKVSNDLEKNPLDATLNPFLAKTVFLQTLHALLIILAYGLEYLVKTYA